MSKSGPKHDPYLDDESDFDEEYFTRTYRPLSNLPTPPPSYKDSSASSPRSLLERDELIDSALLGPAVHLVNLIPPAASLVTPSVPTVHGILERARLPLETIALAVCILDSLNSRFSSSWRLGCPLAAPPEAMSKRHTLPARPVQLHIDAVRPEVVILSALILAVKFLEDVDERTARYASRWGNDLWTCEQINVTERCILQNLGYRILPLWDRGLIDDALADMERAGWQAVAPATATATATARKDDDDSQQQHRRAMSSGKAVSGLGFQITPAESPRIQDVEFEARPRDTTEALVGTDIRAAFTGHHFAPSPATQ